MHPDNNQQDNQRRSNDTAERDQTELERAIATYTAIDLAEHNAQLAQERDQAVDLAANQLDHRALAEQEAQEARISERHSRMEANRTATENTIYRENLASEREAASNASFGFTFLACIVLAALLGLGIWYWTTGSGEPPAETANRPIRIVQPPPVIKVEPAPSAPPASNNATENSANPTENSTGNTEGAAGASDANSGTSDSTAESTPPSTGSDSP
jgi:hypothetical protein